MRPPESFSRGRNSPFLSSFKCLLLCILVLKSTATKEKDSPSKDRSPTKVISLAESINRSQKSLQDPERAKASREQWEQALKEIKDLAQPTYTSLNEYQSSRPGGLFNQWKLLLDEPSAVQLDPETNLTTVTTASQSTESASAKRKRKTRRFEGFASWDRMLQDWAEDVQEYMEDIEAEGTGGYPLSTNGIPSKQEEKEEQKDHISTDSELHSSEPMTKTQKKSKRKPISLPVPASLKEGEEVVPETNIADKSKNVWIVTTASLPWMTGTAVNPLLRAAYLNEGRKEAGGSVTLMLPWLERRKDQDSVYGQGRHFDNPEEQETFIRDWLRNKAKFPQASEELKIEWYTAWQNKVENSLYSMGDITALIPAEEVDIMILEEPEHLNWYRAPGESWTDKFKHVVGIIHTNYFVYAQEQPAAFVRAPGMRLLCAWMIRAHCHRVIKLSGTLGQFAPEKELVENVHGVRGSFLESGEEVRKRLEAPGGAEKDPIFGSEAGDSVYFIGKMLWSKGLASLMELLKYAEESAGIKVHVDMYGGGPDKDAAETKAETLGVDMEFHGPIDHGELGLTHKIFINPSTSEVLCTTVAEALAMGKFVIVPSHPSNDFFAQFPNCLTYTNKEEFVGDLYYALTHAPEPLTTEVAYALSWRAATKRLEAAGCIPLKEAEMMSKALDAGIEISLPPLIEDGKSRELLSNTFRRSRERFRQFRSRLSEEIQQSEVLPNGVKQRMVSELDKRLDLDIQEILESPKLQLQLSPAELDNRLLELYKRIAKGPGGDVLRVIGGGQDVAFQDLYIKRRASRQRARNPLNATALSFGPFDVDEETEDARTASQWVKKTLKRTLPKTKIQIPKSTSSNTKEGTKTDDESKLKMSLSHSSASTRQFGRTSPIQSTAAKHFCPPKRSLSSQCKLLI